MIDAASLNDDALFPEQAPPKLISPGVTEIDKRLGGGLPPSSLTLIEGDPDAGKSVLIMQMVHSALQEGFRVAIFTSESTGREMLRQLEDFGLPLLDYYLLGRLAIYEANLRVDQEGAERLLDQFVRYVDVADSYDLFVIDSITRLMAHFNEWFVLSFLARCKELTGMGRASIVTLHSYSIDDPLRRRANSIVDAHLRLRIEEIGKQLVRTLEVLKIRGAVKTVDNAVSFTVEPGVGIKSVPVGRIQA